MLDYCSDVPARVCPRIVPDIIGIGIVRWVPEGFLEVLRAIEVDHRLVENDELQRDRAEIGYEHIARCKQRVYLKARNVYEPGVLLEPPKLLDPVYAVRIPLEVRTRRLRVADRVKFHDDVDVVESEQLLDDVGAEAAQGAAGVPGWSIENGLSRSIERQLIEHTLPCIASLKQRIGLGVAHVHELHVCEVHLVQLEHVLVLLTVKRAGEKMDVVVPKMLLRICLEFRRLVVRDVDPETGCRSFPVDRSREKNVRRQKGRSEARVKLTFTGHVEHRQLVGVS